MRHRPGGTADGMTTEHGIRDALALFPSLRLEKCIWLPVVITGPTWSSRT